MSNTIMRCVSFFFFFFFLIFCDLFNCYEEITRYNKAREGWPTKKTRKKAIVATATLFVDVATPF